jgi:hypothetical protein
LCLSLFQKSYPLWNRLNYFAFLDDQHPNYSNYFTINYYMALLAFGFHLLLEQSWVSNRRSRSHTNRSICRWRLWTRYSCYLWPSTLWYRYSNILRWRCRCLRYLGSCTSLCTLCCLTLRWWSIWRHCLTRRCCSSGTSLFSSVRRSKYGPSSSWLSTLTITMTPTL